MNKLPQEGMLREFLLLPHHPPRNYDRPSICKEKDRSNVIKRLRNPGKSVIKTLDLS